MRTQTGTIAVTGVRALLVAAALMAIVAPAYAAPATARSYVWHAELTNVDARTRTATVKAPFREHMLRYIDEFHPGDRVTLTWATSHDGEADDDIIFLGRPDKNASSNYGYVLNVELVAVNKTERTITFKVTIPMAAFEILKKIQTGDRVSVTSPFEQSGVIPTIRSVARSEPRPEGASQAPVSPGVSP